MVVLGLLLALALAGCRQSPTPTADAPSTTTVTASPPAATDVTSPNGLQPQVTPDRQLVLWMPDFTGLAHDSSAGAVLDAAFQQFEQAQPSVRIDVQIKSEQGASSLFSYLQSTQKVSPLLLPDLILINTQQLWQLADLGMIPPVSPEEYTFATDYYPFVMDAVTYRGQRMGVPYAADLIHAVYDPRQVETPPQTWDALVEGEILYLFPAGEGSGGDLTALLHYVGAGGVLLEDSTAVDDASLATFFHFLDQAQANGVIDPRAADLPTFNAVWQLYASERPGLDLVQTHNYLENLPSRQDIAFSVVPTHDGTAKTIGTTWAFAVLTADAERRATAFQLIDLLITPEVLGPWSQLANRVPSRRSSMSVWQQEDRYYVFLERLADTAQAPPNGRTFAEFTRRLRVAQVGILRGELNVEQAIQTVRAGQ